MKPALATYTSATPPASFQLALHPHPGRLLPLHLADKGRRASADAGDSAPRSVAKRARAHTHTHSHTLPPSFPPSLPRLSCCPLSGAGLAQCLFCLQARNGLSLLLQLSLAPPLLQLCPGCQHQAAELLRWELCSSSSRLESFNLEAFCFE